MFAKDAENEGESEDEEWGLHVRKKSRKKASEDGCMVVNSIRDANKVLNDDVPTHTSKYSRIPASAVKVYNTFFVFVFVCVFPRCVLCVICYWFPCCIATYELFQFGFSL
jgi:hypothetical protein